VLELLLLPKPEQAEQTPPPALGKSVQPGA